MPEIPTYRSGTEILGIS